MKTGDLVKFWDYEGGDGWVPGLIVKIAPGLPPVPGEASLTAIIMYKNHIQQVPLDKEWIVDIDDESR